MKRVAIVGAGVSGLTCGVELKKAGCDVTMFESDAHEQVSRIAGGVWYPYDISPDDRRRAIKWALESYEVFRELARNGTPGVSMVWFDVRGESLPNWAGAIHSLVTDEGYEAWVPLFDTTLYLPWLRQQLPRIEQRTIATFDELTGAFDLVVNCAGLGARDLCNDRVDLHAGRGVLLRAPYSGPPLHFVDERTLTYVLTRTHDVVMGGTNDAREDGDTSEAARSIAERCSKYLSVEDAKPIHGLRPLRSTVRLEREGRVIHNYGHGGAGITVSWACAHEVVRLARRE